MSTSISLPNLNLGAGDADTLSRIHGELGRLLGKDREGDEANRALEALEDMREQTSADTSCILLIEESLKPDLGSTHYLILAGWCVQLVSGIIALSAFSYETPRTISLYNTTVTGAGTLTNYTNTTLLSTTTEPIFYNPFIYVGAVLMVAAAIQFWYVKQSFSFHNRRNPLWHQRYIHWPNMSTFLLTHMQGVTLVTILLFQKGIGTLEALPAALSTTERHLIFVLLGVSILLAFVTISMSSAHLLGALTANADDFHRVIPGTHDPEEDEKVQESGCCYTTCCSVSIESLSMLVACAYLLEILIAGVMVVCFTYASDTNRWKMAYLFILVCATWVLSSQMRYNTDILVQGRRRPRSSNWHRRHILYPLRLMQVWVTLSWLCILCIVSSNQKVQLWFDGTDYFAAFLALNSTRMRFMISSGATWLLGIYIQYRVAHHHLLVATMPNVRLGTREPSNTNEAAMP